MHLETQTTNNCAQLAVTFAVFIFSRLLLFHFFHVLHICRVHLSLVFADRGDTEGGGTWEGRSAKTQTRQTVCTELTPTTKLLLACLGGSCQPLWPQCQLLRWANYY